MTNVSIFTIGFTKKNAETFFNKLKNAGVKKIIDIRLNNVSQLAGFAKRDDLKFFLRELCNCDYRHEPLLAPTKEILDGYKKKKIDWIQYEKQFVKLMKDREAHTLINSEELDRACFLCSEPTAEKCHRRLVAEYFKDNLGDIKIIHL
jgi:uncharacterized protein (DUF488 family)